MRSPITDSVPPPWPSEMLTKATPVKLETRTKKERKEEEEEKKKIRGRAQQLQEQRIPPDAHSHELAEGDSFHGDQGSNNEGEEARGRIQNGAAGDTCVDEGRVRAVVGQEPQKAKLEAKKGHLYRWGHRRSVSDIIKGNPTTKQLPVSPRGVSLEPLGAHSPPQSLYHVSASSDVERMILCWPWGCSKCPRSGHLRYHSKAHSQAPSSPSSAASGGDDDPRDGLPGESLPGSPRCWCGCCC